MCWRLCWRIQGNKSRKYQRLGAAWTVCPVHHLDSTLGAAHGANSFSDYTETEGTPDSLQACIADGSLYFNWCSAVFTVQVLRIKWQNASFVPMPLTSSLLRLCCSTATWPDLLVCGGHYYCVQQQQGFVARTEAIAISRNLPKSYSVFFFSFFLVEDSSLTGSLEGLWGTTGHITGFLIERRDNEKWDQL